MKKVLIIAYIFPPIGGSGVQRTLKFTRYLPQSGWQPIVVCGDDGDVFHDGYDPSLLAEIPPEATVYRTRFRSPLALRRWLQKILRIKRRAQIDGGSHPTAQAVTERYQPPSRLRRFARLLSLPLAPFEFPPIDAALYWAISIVPLCLRIIQKEKVEVIFTTSFPYADHVAGYLLKRLTGKPWVADFRDPWTQNASARNTGWRRRCDEWMEKAVLSHADRIIGVTPTYLNELRSLAYRKPVDNFLVIENGYDLNDFPQVDRSGLESKNHRQVTIAHVGMAYDGTILPLLDAVQHLAYADQARLKFRFIGGLPPKETIWLADHPLVAEVEITPRLPHAQAVEAMQQADVVFLPIGGGQAWSGHYPGKLFEYMACGTPILLIGSGGDASRLVQLSGTGCPVEAGDLDGAVRILHLIATDLAEFRTRYYQPEPQLVTRYERKFLTQRLVGVFEALTRVKDTFGEKALDRHALS